MARLPLSFFLCSQPMRDDCCFGSGNQERLCELWPSWIAWIVLMKLWNYFGIGLSEKRKNDLLRTWFGLVCFGLRVMDQRPAAIEHGIVQSSLRNFHFPPCVPCLTRLGTDLQSKSRRKLCARSNTGAWAIEQLSNDTWKQWWYFTTWGNPLLSFWTMSFRRGGTVLHIRDDLP